jgi:hypothetical protein
MTVLLKQSDFVGYPSYNNLAKLITEMGSALTLQRFFSTLKIDGSNLGIRVAQDENGEFCLVAIIGRSTFIYLHDSADDATTRITKLTSLSYGNAKALGNLPFVMFEFAVGLAKKLGLTDITVYGEAYRFSKKGNAAASWHPFAYNPVYGQDNSMRRLTRQTYADFEQVALNLKSVHATPVDRSVYASPNALFAFLDSITKPAICPPPVLFYGSLVDGIKFLGKVFEQFVNISKIVSPFEGGFFISDDGMIGFKWKVGPYEEQKSIPSTETVIAALAPRKYPVAGAKEIPDAGASGELVAAYSIIESLFKRRHIEEKKDKVPKGQDPASIALAGAVQAALTHTLGTIANPDAITPASVPIIADAMVKEILRTDADDVEQYAWAPEALLRTCTGAVWAHVKKQKIA